MRITSPVFSAKPAAQPLRPIRFGGYDDGGGWKYYDPEELARQQELERRRQYRLRTVGEHHVANASERARAGTLGAVNQQHLDLQHERFITQLDNFYRDEENRLFLDALYELTLDKEEEAALRQPKLKDKIALKAKNNQPDLIVSGYEILKAIYTQNPDERNLYIRLRRFADDAARIRNAPFKVFSSYMLPDYWSGRDLDRAEFSLSEETMNFIYDRNETIAQAKERRRTQYEVGTRRDNSGMVFAYVKIIRTIPQIPIKPLWHRPSPATIYRPLQPGRQIIIHPDDLRDLLAESQANSKPQRPQQTPKHSATPSKRSANPADGEPSTQG